MSMRSFEPFVSTSTRTISSFLPLILKKKHTVIKTGWTSIIHSHKFKYIYHTHVPIDRFTCMRWHAHAIAHVHLLYAFLIIHQQKTYLPSYLPTYLHVHAQTYAHTCAHTYARPPVHHRTPVYKLHKVRKIHANIVTHT